MADPTMDAANAVMQKWQPIAETQDETSPTVPINVLTAEALDLAFFIQEFWEPRPGQMPGMKEAVVGGLFTKDIAQELRELSVAVSNVHSRYRAIMGSVLVAPVERGEFLLGELKTALEFWFDDGVEDEHDAELERLSASFPKISTHDELAQALDGFAYYADGHREALAALPDFEEGMIDEALVVARRLREQSAIKLSRHVIDEQAAQRELRNKLITLLVDRMRNGRRAARFVYRNHPTVARRAASSYERRRLRARRRAAAEVEQEQPGQAQPSNGRAQPEAPAEA